MKVHLSGICKENFFIFAGVWKDKSELKKLRTEHKAFTPNATDAEKYNVKLVEWREAMKRCQRWYKQGHD